MARDRTVLEASDEAARHGVQVGDTIRLARRQCPGLEVQEFRPENYSDRFEQAWSVIAGFTPMVQTTDLHQGYLDITKDFKRFGDADTMVRSLNEELTKTTGLKFNWGGGADKWMAWLARGHNQFITPAMESLVLSKLPIESMALPERVTERLHHFDIHTVAQVTGLPPGFLESHLGFDRIFVLKFLTRHKEPVRPNFPPRKIESCVDVTESDEFACQRAIAEVASSIATQLADASLQTSCLRIAYKSEVKKLEVDHKLSQGVLSDGRLTKILFDLLPDGMQQSLKSIDVEALRLLPRQVTQDLLWEKSLTNNAGEQLERAQNKLHTRYGMDSLVTGSTAFARQQPRFAQLVYQSRGLTLP
ncbi:MAG: hypothetical protein H6507_00150 [Calditrichaeota bacterium]|nr:hypothetical protein [Calditrichota bacterium]